MANDVSEMKTEEDQLIATSGSERERWDRHRLIQEVVMTAISRRAYAPAMWRIAICAAIITSSICGCAWAWLCRT